MTADGTLGLHHHPHRRISGGDPRHRAPGRSSGLGLGGRLRGGGQELRAAGDVLRHRGYRVQLLRLPGRARLGILPRSGGLLHPVLRRAGHGALLLDGPPCCCPWQALRLRHAGPTPGGAVSVESLIRLGRAAEPGGLHPLRHHPDPRRGNRHRGGNGRPRASLAGGAGGLWHRHHLRAGQWSHGGGMDEYVPGHLHGGHRLDPGHLPALPPVRGRGAHVRADRRRPPGTPGATGTDLHR